MDRVLAYLCRRPESKAGETSFLPRPNYSVLQLYLFLVQREITNQPSLSAICDTLLEVGMCNAGACPTGVPTIAPTFKPLLVQVYSHGLIVMAHRTDIQTSTRPGI